MFYKSSTFALTFFFCNYPPSNSFSLSGVSWSLTSTACVYLSLFSQQTAFSHQLARGPAMAALKWWPQRDGGFFCFVFFWPLRAACGILVPQPGIEPGPLAVKVRSPNHWTTREFPERWCFRSGSRDLARDPCHPTRTCRRPSQSL